MVFYEAANAEGLREELFWFWCSSQTLTLAESTITDDAILSLISGLTRVQKLNVWGCTGLTSAAVRIKFYFPLAFLCTSLSIHRFNYWKNTCPIWIRWSWHFARSSMTTAFFGWASIVQKCSTPSALLFSVLLWEILSSGICRCGDSPIWQREASLGWEPLPSKT